jgi:hypothetical protein
LFALLGDALVGDLVVVLMSVMLLLRRETVDVFPILIRIGKSVRSCYVDISTGVYGEIKYVEYDK